jgi:hypothetical protein
MVFSLEHDIKVTKNNQNLLPTQSVLVAHTVLLRFLYKISIFFLYKPTYFFKSILPHLRLYLCLKNETKYCVKLMSN